MNQELENPRDWEHFSHEPWIKTGANSFKTLIGKEWFDADNEFIDGCLVRTADCKPEVDELEEALIEIAEMHIESHEDAREMQRIAKEALNNHE